MPSTAFIVTGVRWKAVWGSRAALLTLALAAAGSASCGSLTREGTASSYLIITALEGASGQSSTYSTVLSSDVETIVTVNNVPTRTYFADNGRVTFVLGLKDPGSSSSPTTPTQNNLITVTRYRVSYVRSDGRNTPGVDVPHPFDGALTITVPGSGSASAGFTLVRLQAKLEAPLAALAANLNTISTIAQITFYGHDQTGREVSATGQISVNFANWADQD